MAFARNLFDHLSRSTGHRLERAAMPDAWRQDGALGRFPTPAAVLAAASAPEPLARRRAVLRALLHLAKADRLAAEALLAAVAPALRAVAAELCRRSPLERGDVDALVGAGAWEAICAFGGTDQVWADRVVVHRARDMARSALRSELRRARREVARAELAQQRANSHDHELGALVAVDILTRAVARGYVTAGSARLVWLSRVEGTPTTELAALDGRSAEAVSMVRLRAERALRRAVA
jgi:hypothetical protein